MNKSTLLIVISSFLFFNCSSMNSPLKKLEGKWTAGGDQGEGHSWHLEYTFKGSSYNVMGYPPLSESGKMKLKETKGDSLLITFIVKKSDPHYENHDEWLVLKENTLTINSTIFNKSGEAEK